MGEDLQASEGEELAIREKRMPNFFSRALSCQVEPSSGSY
jgi:hypothetical protein